MQSPIPAGQYPGLPQQIPKGVPFQGPTAFVNPYVVPNMPPTSMSQRVGEVISAVADGGLVGDGVTDNWPLLMALFDKIPDGSIIYFPQLLGQSGVTTYKFGQMLSLIRPFGLVAGQFWTSQPLVSFRGVDFTFPAGQTGIVFNAFNTRGMGVIPNDFSNTAATNGFLQNIRIRALGKSTLAYGVFIRCRAYLINCEVRDFATDGVHAEATIADPLIKGNANLWGYDRLDVSGNGRHGLFLEGGDVNAGIGNNLNTGSNGGYGLYDNSFLGYTHIGPTFNGDTLGAYWMGGAVCASIMVGDYIEADQDIVLGAPSQSIGGLGSADSLKRQQQPGSSQLGAQFKGQAPQYRNAVSGKTIMSALGSQGNNTMVHNWGCLEDEGSDTFHSWQYDATNRVWVLMRAGSAGLAEIRLPGSGGAIASIRASAPGFRNGIFIGGGVGIQDGLLEWANTIMPTSGTWQQGDEVKNLSPSIVGSAGSRYVVTGWKRITTGSNNVLNTDWTEMRCPTGT